MIYILEDDDSIRKLVTYALESQGLPAEGFAAPDAFWEAMKLQIPSLLLLDIMLPGESGLEILRKLREDPRTARLPVIILTAKGAEYDRVEGLDSGADDYVTKPFGMMELLARVRALLRRADVTGELRFGNLRIYPERYEVSVKGEPVVLTNKEFRLLLMLAENAGVVMTREVLMDRIWDLGTEPENRTLDVHIRKVRAKLGEAGGMIETVRGVGYRMKV